MGRNIATGFQKLPKSHQEGNLKIKLDVRYSCGIEFLWGNVGKSVKLEMLAEGILLYI